MGSIYQNTACVFEGRFLFFWKYRYIKHTDAIYSIGKFMDCADDFVVKRKCTVCGRIETDRFCSYDSLVLNGISPEILKSITMTKTFYSIDLNNEKTE